MGNKAGFANKTVWITGASSGIGKELAHQFADQGARVVLSARRGDVLETVRAALTGGVERHWVVPLDLADADSLMESATKALSDIGPVDILVNNGGISQRGLFLETDFSVYRRIMDVNYLGTVALTKVVLPGMVDRGTGSVVCISSVAGKVGSKLRTGYSGSKFAVVGFMDCLRAEVSSQGVQCLTVCPGFINTDIAKNALDANGKAQQTNEASIEEGLTAGECCQQIISAIEQGKDEIVIGKGISGLAPTIKRFFPGLYNTLAARREHR
ncbi:3-oxoacyl-ACP reductase [Gammaproteobacteria bacterium 42_54_T18]|nr:3-oxoacyl-ACP reductase [Gammaproteobacteria bacterium 42_54_T18]